MTSRLRGLVTHLLTLMLLMSSASASDFGVAQWGASMADVREQETLTNLTPLNASNYLIYEVALPGIHRARLVYEFENGLLHQGYFLLSPDEGASVSAWIQQFDQVRTLLSQQYQNPDQQQILTPEGISQPSPAHWAQALQADQLILKNHWRLESTNIVQQLAWREQQPHHQVIYRPTAR